MLLMLTGCEADTSIAPFPNEGEEPVEVRLHATTFGASVEVSRASDETIPLPENTQVGMWGGTYQNLALNYDPNTQALNTTDQSKIYYPLQTETMNICAYAPYSTEAYNEEDHTIWVRSGLDENSNRSHYITDPIWAKTSVTKEDAENNVIDASLKFQHAMSRLQIYLVHDEDEKENEEKEYEVHLIKLAFDCPQCGKMSIETGYIESDKPTEENYEYSLIYDRKHTLNETEENYYTHTILPGSVLKKIYVTFKTTNNSGVYQYDYTTEGKEPPAFKTGETTKMIVNFAKIPED